MNGATDAREQAKLYIHHRAGHCLEACKIMRMLLEDYAAIVGECRHLRRERDEALAKIDNLVVKFVEGERT